MSASVSLTGVIADFVDAVNAFDTDAVVATFTDDAIVNDARREIRGRDAIRAFVAREITGDHLVMDVIETSDHHGTTIVRAAYDGDFDKTNLPDPLVLNNYVTVHDGRITTLITILATPSGY